MNYKSFLALFASFSIATIVTAMERTQLTQQGIIAHSVNTQAVIASKKNKPSPKELFKEAIARRFIEIRGGRPYFTDAAIEILQQNIPEDCTGFDSDNIVIPLCNKLSLNNPEGRKKIRDYLANYGLRTRNKSFNTPRNRNRIAKKRNRAPGTTNWLSENSGVNEIATETQNPKRTRPGNKVSIENLLNHSTPAPDANNNGQPQEPPYFEVPRLQTQTENKQRKQKPDNSYKKFVQVFPQWPHVSSQLNYPSGQKPSNIEFVQVTFPPKKQQNNSSQASFQPTNSSSSQQTMPQENRPYETDMISFMQTNKSSCTPSVNEKKKVERERRHKISREEYIELFLPETHPNLYPNGQLDPLELYRIAEEIGCTQGAIDKAEEDYKAYIKEQQQPSQFLSAFLVSQQQVMDQQQKEQPHE